MQGMFCQSQAGRSLDGGDCSVPASGLDSGMVSVRQPLTSQGPTCAFGLCSDMKTQHEHEEEQQQTGLQKARLSIGDVF